MKVVILAGGLGTRLSEETGIKPKPMIEIGGMPILWHIMKCYSKFGLNEFVICLGYKGYMIKEFFNNYFLHTSDITIDIKNNSSTIHNSKTEPWKITLVDTGDGTMTGGRIKKIKKYVGDTFCVTYGDGLSNVNVEELLKVHKKNKKIATITAVQPQGRFGALQIKDNKVIKFQEKPKMGEGWINGGFFVFEKEIFEYVKNDQTVLEKEPLEKLSSTNNLIAYKHTGFWQPMDTLRDKKYLEKLWMSKNPPWKIW